MYEYESGSTSRSTAGKPGSTPDAGDQRLQQALLQRKVQRRAEQRAQQRAAFARRPETMQTALPRVPEKQTTRLLSFQSPSSFRFL